MMEYELETHLIRKILLRAGYDIKKSLIDDLRGKRAWKHIVKEFDY
jgi:hypothetical protein